MAPAAAVVATAVIAIYIHERNIERGAETAKVEQLRTSERPALPPPATPLAPEQNTQPAAPRSAPTKKTERTAATTRIPVAEPDEMSSAPPPESMNGLLPGRGGPTEDSVLEGRRRTDEALSPTEAAPEGAPPTEATAYEEERMKHAEEAAEDRRQFAAKAPMSSSDHGSGREKASGGAPGKNEPVDISAQQLEMQPAPQAGYLQLHGIRSMVNVPAGPYGFHLPSGRPAVSIASADHRLLAVDEKGTLFLREDSGGPWEKVERQWTGRAVAVHRHANLTAPTGATPVPETEESPAASGGLSQPGTVFELVNDQSQVWISADGRIWTAK